MREGSCTRCHKKAWINTVTTKADGIGEWCADCFDEAGPLRPRPHTAGNSGGNHNDPGFDNAIRAYEEDR